MRDFHLQPLPRRGLPPASASSSILPRRMKESDQPVDRPAPDFDVPDQSSKTPPSKIDPPPVITALQRRNAGKSPPLRERLRAVPLQHRSCPRNVVKVPHHRGGVNRGLLPWRSCKAVPIPATRPICSSIPLLTSVMYKTPGHAMGCGAIRSIRRTANPRN